MSSGGLFKIVFLILLAIVFTLSPASPNKHNETKESIQIDKTILKTGDLIFRRGLSLISNIVLLADKGSEFSHVGMICVKDDDVFVIHITTDESDDGVDRVKLDYLAQFLRIDRAAETAVYRLKDAFQLRYAGISVENALKFYDQNILFDAALDLTDSQKLYCTELIWKAYYNSGIDLINSKFDELSTPLGKGLFILPGNLLKSPYLKPIVLNTQYREAQ